jgi:hypothetical protein
LEYLPALVEFIETETGEYFRFFTSFRMTKKNRSLQGAVKINDTIWALALNNPT